jgi:phosphatidylglycerophosphatase A
MLVVQGGSLAVAGTAAAITLGGVWAASVVARQLDRKDPQLVVVDEVAGMLVTMIPMHVLSWKAVIVGFALFRFFDILKPWPIRRFENLPSGWGIVLDDVVAGVFGAAIMAGARWLGMLP